MGTLAGLSFLLWDLTSGTDIQEPDGWEMMSVIILSR